MKRKKPSGAGAKVKAGKPKGGDGRKKPKKQALREDVPLPEEVGSEEELEVSDEDLEFVQQHSRQLGFLKNLDKSALDKSVKDAQKRDAAAARKAAEAAGAEGGTGEEDEDMAGLEAYERGPRRSAKEEGPKSRGLPIKTLEGAVVFEKNENMRGPRAQQDLPKASQLVQVAGITVEDDLEAALKAKEEAKAAEAVEAAAREKAERKRAEKAAAESALPPSLLALQSLQSREQRRAKAREAMAVAAQKLLAGPEEAVAELKVLNGLLADQDAQVSRLAMVSLLAVFRDILPGYRIRPPSEKEAAVKVSKDVARLREYEAVLLKHYQAFLKQLLAQSKPPHVTAHIRVAVRCMAGLLTTHPHFNYTSDLLQALVPFMGAPDTEARALACDAVRALLSSQETAGRVCLEAVQLVADLVRVKKCVCPPEVVQALSVLRFTEVKGPKEEGATANRGKKAQPKKRARTAIDEEVDKDFKEAEAGPDRRALAILQSQMLEALFEVYFRVLKNCTSCPLLTRNPDAAAAAAAAAATAPAQGGAGAGPSSAGQAVSASGPRHVHNSLTTPLLKGSAAPAVANGHAGDKQGGGKSKGSKGGAAAVEASLTGPSAPGLGVARERLLSKHPLLYPVLEGLARYAHLISVEYFNDLMSVFHQLLRAPGLPLLERLRVLASASDILRGQGEALNIDRKAFYSTLYEALLSVPVLGLADEQHQHQQQGTAKGAGRGQGAHENDEDEAADPPNTAALASSSAGGRLLTGQDGQPDAKAVEEPMSVLLGTVLGQMLVEPKIIDMARLAAFAKRAATMALAAGPGEALVLLGCVLRLMRRYPRLQSLVEWEGEAPVGGRPYDAYCPDPSEAGALAASMWELSLLRNHFHPHVAQAAASILNTMGHRAHVPGQPAQAAPQLSGPLAAPGTLKDLGIAHARIARGGFQPAPTLPGKVRGSKPGRGISAAALSRLMTRPASEECGALLQASGVAIPANAPVQLEVSSDVEDVDMDGPMDEETAVAHALSRHYRAARRFEVNASLRQEKIHLVEKIKKFQIHLHTKGQVAGAGVSKQKGARLQIHGRGLQ